MIVCVENIHVHVCVLLKLTIIIDVMNKYTTNRLSHVLKLTTIPLCVMMHLFSEIISVESRSCFNLSLYFHSQPSL